MKKVAEGMELIRLSPPSFVSGHTKTVIQISTPSPCRIQANMGIVRQLQTVHTYCVVLYDNHMHSLGLADNACCECGPTRQTVSHVLMDYPLLST